MYDAVYIYMLIVMVLHMSGYNDVHSSCAVVGLAMGVGGLGIRA